MSRRINTLIGDMQGDGNQSERLEHVRLLLLQTKVKKLTEQAEKIKSSRAVAEQEEIYEVIKDFFVDIIAVLTLWKDINDAQDLEASSIAAIPSEITKLAEWETCNGKLCRLEREMESQFKFMRTTYQTVYQRIIEREATASPPNHNYTKLLNALSSEINQLQNDIVFFKKPLPNEMDPYEELEKTLNSFKEEVESLFKFMSICKNLGEPSLWCVRGNSVTFFYCESTEEESSQQLPHCPHKVNCRHS